MRKAQQTARSLLRLWLPVLLLAGLPAGAQEPGLSGEAPGAETQTTEEPGVPAPDFVEPPPEEPLPPPRWFRSNAGGLALEEIPSRLAALRHEYALGLDYIAPGGLPEILASRYEAPWRAEIRVLYKNGEESRRQWIFRDAAGATRLTAVFDQDILNPPPPPRPAEPGAGAAGPEAANEAAGETAQKTESPETPAPAGPALTGFIERYNGEGQIVAEHIFQEGGEAQSDFFYHQGRLVRAETRQKIQADGGEQMIPVYTDLYRYNRAASLRAVERTYHEGAEAGSPVNLRFPHMVLDAAADKDFISPGVFYATGFPEEYLIGAGYMVLYTTDSRGRILTETRQDNAGTVIAELINTWSGDRLSSALLKAGDVERRTEYQYNSRGDRILERNYRNGILERLVRGDGNREVEELFMNGEVILRAIWEDGRKISEERIRPGR
ncbi:MAG: hypothetical protein LBK27_06640 [Treponema sp.]|nr:hypothetical protein [Treponema sp.]